VWHAMQTACKMSFTAAGRAEGYKIILINSNPVRWLLGSWLKPVQRLCLTLLPSCVPA